MSSYSKAPWGLSVLSQVTGIFTGITISPSLLLRQCPNRYAFRAGRNLPDKEFRYLRTVIVTAALALGYSPHPPVSVCGTGTFNLDRDFSRQCEISYFATKFRSASYPSIIPTDLPIGTASILART